MRWQHKIDQTQRSKQFLSWSSKLAVLKTPRTHSDSCATADELFLFNVCIWWTFYSNLLYSNVLMYNKFLPVFANNSLRKKKSNKIFLPFSVYWLCVCEHLGHSVCGLTLMMLHSLINISTGRVSVWLEIPILSVTFSSPKSPPT